MKHGTIPEDEEGEGGGQWGADVQGLREGHLLQGRQVEYYTRNTLDFRKIFFIFFIYLLKLV